MNNLLSPFDVDNTITNNETIPSTFENNRRKKKKQNNETAEDNKNLYKERLVVNFVYSELQMDVIATVIERTGKELFDLLTRCGFFFAGMPCMNCIVKEDDNMCEMCKESFTDKKWRSIHRKREKFLNNDENNDFATLNKEINLLLRHRATLKKNTIINTAQQDCTASFDLGNILDELPIEMTVLSSSNPSPKTDCDSEAPIVQATSVVLGELTKSAEKVQQDKFPVPANADVTPTESKNVTPTESKNVTPTESKDATSDKVDVSTETKDITPTESVENDEVVVDVVQEAQPAPVASGGKWFWFW